MAGAGGMQNFGNMINDVYETKFKNMEKKTDGKKLCIKMEFQLIKIKKETIIII